MTRDQSEKTNESTERGVDQVGRWSKATYESLQRYGNLYLVGIEADILTDASYGQLVLALAKDGDVEEA